MNLLARTDFCSLLVLLTFAGCAKSRSADSTQVDRRPSYNHAELAGNATYPEIARENNLEGRVILMVYLDKTGTVTKVEVAQSDNKIFNMAAIEAVRATTFTPAIHNGLGVSYKLPVIVQFKLNDSKEEMEGEEE